MLGFFSDVEYYAFLVAAGLAGYTGRKIGPDGKNQLEIYSDEWKGLLTNTKLNLSSDIAEHSVKEFDMEGLIVNNKQDFTNRYQYHVLRFGSKESDTYANKITLQKNEKGRFDFTPPLLPSLRSMQRSFKQNVQDFIADIIIENNDMYDDATIDRIRMKSAPKPISQYTIMSKQTSHEATMSAENYS